MEKSVRLSAEALSYIERMLSAQNDALLRWVTTGSMLSVIIVLFALCSSAFVWMYLRSSRFQNRDVLKLATSFHFGVVIAVMAWLHGCSSSGPSLSSQLVDPNSSQGYADPTGNGLTYAIATSSEWTPVPISGAFPGEPLRARFAELSTGAYFKYSQEGEIGLPNDCRLPSYALPSIEHRLQGDRIEVRSERPGCLVLEFAGEKFLKVAVYDALATATARVQDRLLRNPSAAIVAPTVAEVARDLGLSLSVGPAGEPNTFRIENTMTGAEAYVGIPSSTERNDVAKVTTLAQGLGFAPQRSPDSEVVPEGAIRTHNLRIFGFFGLGGGPGGGGGDSGGISFGTKHEFFWGYSTSSTHLMNIIFRYTSPIGHKGLLPSIPANEKEILWSRPSDFVFPYLYSQLPPELLGNFVLFNAANPEDPNYGVSKMYRPMADPGDLSLVWHNKLAEGIAGGLRLSKSFVFGLERNADVVRVHSPNPAGPLALDIPSEYRSEPLIERRQYKSLMSFPTVEEAMVQRTNFINRMKALTGDSDAGFVSAIQNLYAGLNRRLCPIENSYAINPNRQVYPTPHYSFGNLATFTSNLNCDSPSTPRLVRSNIFPWIHGYDFIRVKTFADGSAALHFLVSTSLRMGNETYSSYPLATFTLLGVKAVNPAAFDPFAGFGSNLGGSYWGSGSFYSFGLKENFELARDLYIAGHIHHVHEPRVLRLPEDPLTPESVSEEISALKLGAFESVPLNLSDFSVGDREWVYYGTNSENHKRTRIKYQMRTMECTFEEAGECIGSVKRQVRVNQNQIPYLSNYEPLTCMARVAGSGLTCENLREYRLPEQSPYTTFGVTHVGDPDSEIDLNDDWQAFFGYHNAAEAPERYRYPTWANIWNLWKPTLLARLRSFPVGSPERLGMQQAVDFLQLTVDSRLVSLPNPVIDNVRTEDSLWMVGSNAFQSSRPTFRGNLWGLQGGIASFADLSCDRVYSNYWENIVRLECREPEHQAGADIFIGGTSIFEEPFTPLDAKQLVFEPSGGKFKEPRGHYPRVLDRPIVWEAAGFHDLDFSLFGNEFRYFGDYYLPLIDPPDEDRTAHRKSEYWDFDPEPATKLESDPELTDFRATMMSVGPGWSGYIPCLDRQRWFDTQKPSGAAFASEHELWSRRLYNIIWEEQEDPPAPGEPPEDPLGCNVQDPNDPNPSLPPTPPPPICSGGWCWPPVGPPYPGPPGINPNPNPCATGYHAVTICCENESGARECHTVCQCNFGSGAPTGGGTNESCGATGEFCGYIPGGEIGPGCLCFGDGCGGTGGEPGGPMSCAVFHNPPPNGGGCGEGEYCGDDSNLYCPPGTIFVPPDPQDPGEEGRCCRPEDVDNGPNAHDCENQVCTPSPNPTPPLPGEDPEWDPGNCPWPLGPGGPVTGCFGGDCRVCHDCDPPPSPVPAACSAPGCEQCGPGDCCIVDENGQGHCFNICGPGEYLGNGTCGPCDPDLEPVDPAIPGNPSVPQDFSVTVSGGTLTSGMRVVIQSSGSSPDGRVNLRLESGSVLVGTIVQSGGALRSEASTKTVVSQNSNQFILTPDASTSDPCDRTVVPEVTPISTVPDVNIRLKSDGVGVE